MKYLIIFAVIVVAYAQAADDIKEMIKKASAECKDKVKASPDEIKQFIQHVPPTTTTGKCFIACVNKKFKVQDESGQIDPYATRDVLKMYKSISHDLYDNLNNVADICLLEAYEITDACEIAFNWITCVMKESKAAGLPPLLAEF